MESGTKKADYRKFNDRSMNSSKYHKKDGTAVRAKLKSLAKKEAENEQANPADSKSERLERLVGWF